MLTCSKKEAIQHQLIDWFKKNQRDLPWRHNRNPYNVWVSEIMLQQTQVDTVIPYYKRFMERFPTIEALAEADEAEVLKEWEGLGYYSRARNLHTAVREVVAQYGGVVPDAKEQISQLKGIGPYTAGAILSFAYGKPEPAVDGNVMRVLSRLFAIGDDVGKAATKKKLECLAKQLIPEGDAALFNEGLIELGALICTPREPSCMLCPLLNQCMGRAKGIHETLPVKQTKTPIRTVRLVCGVIYHDENVLLRQRPASGLLARMWEFPNTEGSSVSAILPELNVQWEDQVGNIIHTYSHLRWHMTVYRGIAKTKDVSHPHLQYVPYHLLAHYAIPKVFQKVWQLASQRMVPNSKNGTTN